jgi:hypothetical protein
MTGGLQEQVTDGQAWFGFGIEPSSKSIIGSQDVPYIYEDRMNKEEFIEVMVKFYEMSKQDRESMGASGREHVLKNYGFKQYSELWKSTFDTIIEKFGSWENRKNYKNWEIREIL